MMSLAQSLHRLGWLTIVGLHSSLNHLLNRRPDAYAFSEGGYLVTVQQLEELIEARREEMRLQGMIRWDEAEEAWFAPGAVAFLADCLIQLHNPTARAS